MAAVGGEGWEPQGQPCVCHQHLHVSWEIRLGSVTVTGKQSGNSLLHMRGCTPLSLPAVRLVSLCSPPGAAAPRRLHSGSTVP